MNIKEVLENAKSLGGANFWYGLRMRPSGLGCHPKNTSANISNELALSHFDKIADKKDIRHGAIAFANELSNKEIASFELIDLNITLTADNNVETKEVITQAINIMLSWFSGSLSNAKDVRELKNELTEDGEYLLQQAYKEMPYLKNRKENPQAFKAFRQAVTVITPKMLLDTVIEATA